jgi:hypothetical protein
MIFSFLIASIRAGSTTAINITNRCGVDGAVDHAFMVTLKPPPANNSNGRRLDAKDRLSYLQDWVYQYDPEDTSNGTARRKLEANSNSTQVLHLFTATQLAVAVSTSDNVRHTPMQCTRPYLAAGPPRCIYAHTRPHVHASDHRAHGQGPGRLLD